jgi:hypothetical protein
MQGGTGRGNLRLIGCPPGNFLAAKRRKNRKGEMMGFRWSEHEAAGLALSQFKI